MLDPQWFRAHDRWTAWCSHGHTDGKKRSLSLKHLFPLSLLVWVQISPPLAIVSGLPLPSPSWKAWRKPAGPRGEGQYMHFKLTHAVQALLNLLGYWFLGSEENFLSLTLEFFFPLSFFLHCSVRCSETSEEMEKQISLHMLKQS